MITLTVNGKPRELDASCTLLALLERFDVNPQLVAVEHNGEIVHRDRYGEVQVSAGDVIEIVHMVGGGS